jgi:hypothetical protein
MSGGARKPAQFGWLSTLTHDDMQLAGIPDSAPRVDICAGIE